MVNINDAYSSYLSAEDLNGQPVTLTISRVEVKTFDDGNRKAAVFFHGMALKRTTGLDRPSVSSRPQRTSRARSSPASA